MNDRSLVLPGPLVEAVLSGLKTKHREPIAKQPPDGDTFAGNVSNSRRVATSDWNWFNGDPDDAATWHPLGDFTLPYAVGCQVWMKEDWRVSPAFDDLAPSALGGEESVRYEVDRRWQTWGAEQPPAKVGRLRYGRYMPTWASRAALRVGHIEVKRLQDISEKEAEAEGVAAVGYIDENDVGCRDYVLGFAKHWNSLYGADAWDKNPWVSVISFSCVKQELPK